MAKRDELAKSDEVARSQALPATEGATSEGLPASEGAGTSQALASSGGTSQALAVPEPSPRAVLRRYIDQIATSPLSIQRGEAIALDKRGVPVGRKRIARIVLAWQVGIYGALITSAVLALSGAWIPGALMYGGVLAPVLWAKRRGNSALMAIEMLAREGKLDEAQKRLDEVPELRRRNPVLYCHLAGSLASHRGDYEMAVKWWREGFPRSKGITRERLKLSIAKALLLGGRTVEARRTFDDVKFPLESDDILTGYILARVMFALLEEKQLPSEDDLHDWTRRALAYSHTGVELAALGWAFERSGDEDMTTLLASEAVERMHYPYLATWWPALQHWLDGRMAKSGVSGASPDGEDMSGTPPDGEDMSGTPPDASSGKPPTT